MANYHRNPRMFSRHHKGKQFILNQIVAKIEKGSQKSLKQLKKELSEDGLFYFGLQFVTTTKKAYCHAIDIPVEAGCRYKRHLEKNGNLVQSVDRVVCPFTSHLAHLISTNPNEFESLRKSKTNQLNLFNKGGAK